MCYLKTLENGKIIVCFEGEPDYCYPLPMSPSKREDQLNQGIWLVLVVAVWSVPDMQSMDIALTAVKKYKGLIKLGIRPFDNYKEIFVWCPEAQKTTACPFWLFFNDGLGKKRGRESLISWKPSPPRGQHK